MELRVEFYTTIEGVNKRLLDIETKTIEGVNKRLLDIETTLR